MAAHARPEMRHCDCRGRMPVAERWRQKATGASDGWHFLLTPVRGRPVPGQTGSGTAEPAICDRTGDSP